jgi:hypothetical protein
LLLPVPWWGTGGPRISSCRCVRAVDTNDAELADLRTRITDSGGNDDEDAEDEFGMVKIPMAKERSKMREGRRRAMEQRNGELGLASRSFCDTAKRVSPFLFSLP